MTDAEQARAEGFFAGLFVAAMMMTIDDTNDERLFDGETAGSVAT